MGQVVIVEVKGDESGMVQVESLGDRWLYVWLDLSIFRIAHSLSISLALSGCAHERPNVGGCGRFLVLWTEKGCGGTVV